MILAAGFGTRLLPHSGRRPKPLFPLLNEPLLLLTIRRLQRFGFDHIIVNCHHLRQQVVDQLRGVAGVVIQQEETILGTGGGLRRAMPVMRDEPLLVTNGDIYHLISYHELYAFHQRTGRSITLAMHDYPRFNTVPVAAGKVVGFGNEPADLPKLAFTGLSVIEPSLLAGIADGEESCIIAHYRQLLKRGIEIGVYRADHCFWTDMGTVDDYLQLHGGLLGGTIPRWREFTYQGAEPILVSETASLSGPAELVDWCAVGAVRGRNVSLARCVVWDGLELPDGFAAHDAVISLVPECR
ncbi:MAG: NDP-sugar synthase [Desulfopila sp.]